MGCNTLYVPELSIISAFVLSSTTSTVFSIGMYAKSLATRAQAPLQYLFCSSSMHNVGLILVFVESLPMAFSHSLIWHGE